MRLANRVRPVGARLDGNLVLDVAIDGIDDDTDAALRAIPGVVATGLFVGYDYELHVAGR